MIAARTATPLRSALSAARVAAPRTSAAAAARVAAPRTVTTLAEKKYTAHGRATGAGRDGHAGLVGDKVGLEVSLGWVEAMAAR